MKIIFSKPINDEDGVRNSLTVDHWIFYPNKEIVLNTRSGISRTIAEKDLPQQIKDALTSFLGSLAQEFRSNYEANPSDVSQEISSTLVKKKV